MPNQQPHVVPVRSRREFLAKAGSGLGAIALGHLLNQSGFIPQGLAKEAVRNPLAAKPPHHPPKAKFVIWLFMEGGPSHVDLFDPKPMLDKLAGQPMPPSFDRPITAMGTADNTLMPSKRKWNQFGESGLWVSDWYPHTAQHVDKLAVIRSCVADGLNHVGSVSQMNTGSHSGGPSFAWSLGHLRARHGEREPAGVRHPYGLQGRQRWRENVEFGFSCPPAIRELPSNAKALRY